MVSPIEFYPQIRHLMRHSYEMCDVLPSKSAISGTYSNKKKDHPHGPGPSRAEHMDGLFYQISRLFVQFIAGITDSRSVSSQLHVSVLSP